MKKNPDPTKVVEPSTTQQEHNEEPFEYAIS